MKTKIFWWIITSCVLGLAVVAVCLILGKSPGENTDTPKTDDDPSGQVEIIETPPEIDRRVNRIESDSVIAESHPELLNTSILKQIDLITKGSPFVDSDGNYSVDEYGEIIRETSHVIEYDNVKENMQWLVDRFHADGYSDEAIQQIQRLYYHYCTAFNKMTTGGMLSGLLNCIPKEGTNAEELTKNAESEFGFIREDGYPFVFEDDMVADEYLPNFAVRDTRSSGYTEDLESLCLYGALHNAEDDGYERNLENWFHRIIGELHSVEYGEKELIEAQLLYYGSLADLSYRSDLIDAIRTCIPQDREIGFDELKENVDQVFSVDLSANILLFEYLNGQAVFEGVIS